MKVVSKSSGGKKTSFRLLDGEIEGYGVHMYILTVSIALSIAMGTVAFSSPFAGGPIWVVIFSNDIRMFFHRWESCEEVFWWD